MDGDTLIHLEGVSKKYCYSLKRSIRYGLQDIARDTLGLQVAGERLRPDEFWAVRDVSFEVRRGQCLGIIGPNGAGKSTLLKMISGIFPPDAGTISVRGRVGAMIEVGAGFHPLLSGRENIYITGAIYGMRKREVDSVFDEIVAFADIGDALDMPVKHYSSGMYARLGFSIYAHLKHDILLIDEVLAVGDAQFQQKCFRKISQLLDEGVPVIFISHDLFNIQKVCTDCVVLANGRVEFSGSPGDAIRDYGALLMNRTEDVVNRLQHKEEISVDSIEFVGAKKTGGIANVVSGKPLRAHIWYRVQSARAFDGGSFELRFWTAAGALAAVVNSKLAGQPELRLQEEGFVEVSISEFALAAGYYRVAGGFRSADDIDTHGWSRDLAKLHVTGASVPGGIAHLNAKIRFQPAHENQSKPSADVHE